MKHFIIEFNTEESMQKWIPEDYLQNHNIWYIDNSVIPNTRRPIDEDEKQKLIAKDIHFIDQVESQWGDTEFNIFKTFTLVLSENEGSRPEPDVTITVVKEAKPKSVMIQVDEPESTPEPEPTLEPEPTPEPIILIKPKKSVIKEASPRSIPEPVVKKTNENKEKRFEAASMIYPPEFVSGGSSDTPEVEVFNAISSQLKRIRNRKLKIEVLIGDLEGCEQQGFAVDAAYAPLYNQIDTIKQFESSILEDLKRIIKKCEDTYPSQY